MLGVVSPSPGGPDEWARTEARTKSQKEVYGGINRHSNQRERRTTAVIFLSQRNCINPGQPGEFSSNQKSSSLQTSLTKNKKT
jgi:hypothetical protein